MVELLPFAVMVAYLFPFVVGAARGHDAVVPILIANLLLGWTGIGWLVVLAWAAASPARGIGGEAHYRRAAAASAGRRSVRPRILHRAFGGSEPPAPSPEPRAKT